MSFIGAGRTIDNEVCSWPEVATGPHRFGGTEYRIGRREIGHRHGDVLVDIPFPLKVRDELILSGRASNHHIYPDSGWVSVHIKGGEDVENAVALLRMSYNTALGQSRSRKQKA